MLHIILLILKIIGIVLLSIVGIILLSIACVLLVPVRYRIRLTREEGEGKPPIVVYVKVTWLLHLINVLIRYPAEVMVRARIMIFTLFRIPAEEKKLKSKKPKKIKESKAEPESYAEAVPDTDQQKLSEQAVKISEEERENAAVSTVTEGYTAFGGDDEEFIQHEPEKEEPEEPEGKKSLFAQIKGIFAKIKQIIEKIKAFFENIQYTIRKFCDKIKAVSDNIQYYREVLESDSFRKSAELCKSELGRAFKKLKPDRLEADLIVGMEDPAATGEILAICGMLYPLIGPHVRIAGDFDCEKTHIEGRLYLRGKIRAITFIRTAVRIYFNKDIKKLIKLLKKEAV